MTARVLDRGKAPLPSSSSSSYSSTYDRRPAVASSIPHSSQAAINAHTAAAQLSKQLAAHREQTRQKQQQQEQLTQQRHQAALQALHQQQQAVQQADLQFTQRQAEKQKQEEQRRTQAAKQAREKKQLLPEHLREMGIHDITQTQTHRQTQSTQAQPQQQQQQQQSSNTSSSSDRYREELLRREDQLRKQLNDEREAAAGLRVDEDDEALRRIRQMRQTLEQHRQEEQQQEAQTTAATAAAVQSAMNVRTRTWMEGSYANNVSAALALSSAPSSYIPEQTKSNKKGVANDDARPHDLESSSLSSITANGNDEEEEDREEDQTIDQSSTHTAEINIRIHPTRRNGTETKELVTPPLPSALASVFNSSSASAASSLLPPRPSGLDVDQLDPAVSSSLAALTSSTEKSIRELTHMLNEMMQGFQISPEIDDEYMMGTAEFRPERRDAARRTEAPRSTAYVEQIEADAQTQEEEDKADEKKTAKKQSTTAYPPLSFSFADSQTKDRRSQSAKEPPAVPTTAARLPNSSSSSSVGATAATTGPTTTEQERKKRVAAQEEEWSKMLSSLEQQRSSNSNASNPQRIGLFIPSVLGTSSSAAAASSASSAVNNKDTASSKQKKDESNVDVSSLIDFDVSDPKEIETQKRIEEQIKQQQERQQTRKTQQQPQQPTQTQPNAKQKEEEREKKAPSKQSSETARLNPEQPPRPPPAGYASALRFYTSLGNPSQQASAATSRTQDKEDSKKDTEKTSYRSSPAASATSFSSTAFPLLISTSAPTAELRQWLEQLQLQLKHREKVEQVLLARERQQTQPTETSNTHKQISTQERDSEEQKEKSTPSGKHTFPNVSRTKSKPRTPPAQQAASTDADVDIIPLAAPFVLVTKRNKPYQHKSAQAERRSEEPDLVNYVVTAPTSFDASGSSSSSLPAAADSLQACFARTHPSLMRREQQRERHTLEHKYDREHVNTHQSASKQSFYSRHHQQPPKQKKHGSSRTKMNVTSSSVLRDLSNNSAFLADYPYASSSFHPKKKHARYSAASAIARDSYVSYAEEVGRMAERSFRTEAARKWHQLPEVRKRVHEQQLKEEKRRSVERRKSYDQQRRAVESDWWYRVPTSNSSRHNKH